MRNSLWVMFKILERERKRRKKVGESECENKCEKYWKINYIEMVLRVPRLCSREEGENMCLCVWSRTVK